MEDAVPAVAQSGLPQGQDSLFRIERLSVPGNQTQRNDPLGAGVYGPVVRLHRRVASLYGRVVSLIGGVVGCVIGCRLRRTELRFTRPLTAVFEPGKKYRPKINPDDGQEAKTEEHPAQFQHESSHYIAASWTASSMSTATNRETPGSLMVTPVSCCMDSMVVLLCVIRTNCTR